MEQFCYHQAEISGALEKCTAPHLCPHTCAKLPISPVCVPMPRPYPISLRSESLGIGFRQLVFLRLPRWLQGTANFKHHWFRIFACLLPYLYAPDFFKLFFFFSWRIITLQCMLVSAVQQHKSIIWPRNSITGHIPWENHNLKRHVYLNVYYSTVYSSQNTEAT